MEINYVGLLQAKFRRAVMREKAAKNAQFMIINEHFEAIFGGLMPYKFGLQQPNYGSDIFFKGSSITNV